MDTNIAIFKYIKESLERPYSNCLIKNNINLEAGLRTEYVELFTKLNLNYRSLNCDNMCYQLKILKACGCIDLNLKYDNLKKVSVDRFCNHEHNTSDSICLANLFADNGKALNDECEADCPLECDSTSYTFSNSYSIFPTDSSYSKLKKTSKYINFLHSVRNVEKELIKVNIYFDEMNYQYHGESPAMTVTDLLGNLGGTLGLFLGFSVLSTVEIIEFVINYYKNIKLIENSKFEISEST